MKETEVILKSMLFHVKSAKTLHGAIIALESMCDEETIAYAEKKVDEFRKKEASQEGN